MRITARWIWNGTEPPFPGTIEVEGGAIAAVHRDSGTPSSEDTIPALLTVGLANAHVHLDLTLPPPPAPAKTAFGEWLAGVVETRRRIGREGLEAAAAAGVRSSLAAGVTLIFDYDPGGWSGPALVDSPLRRVVFREVIALGPDDLRTEAIDAFLAEEGDPAVEWRGLAPHAPYTVHPEVLPAVIARAEGEGRPWSMHVAECGWERELLVDGRGEGVTFITGFGADAEAFATGATAVERLTADGQLTSRTLLVHGNHLDEGEIAAIAKSRAALVYCPRSHAYFGHRPHPFPRLHDAGVPLMLGTDGAISAGDLDLLSEMREARRVFPDLPVETWWRAATLTPRAYLGGRFGSGTIAVGEPADLAMWMLPPRSEAPLEDALVFTKPMRVWIGGERVAGYAVEGP